MGNLTVMISGAFHAPYAEVLPEFERRTGCSVTTLLGSSEGGAPDCIPERLKRGEPTDIVVMARRALDAMVMAGHVVRGSEVDLIRSKIAMAVRPGLPVPDISTAAAFRKAMLEAKSIAYAASVSGSYVTGEVFARLGIADAVMPKARCIYSERVGRVLLRGEADIGFQQLSELVPIEGIVVVGTLPEELQRVTIFSTGIARSSADPAAARELIEFLASPAAHAAIARFGLEPAG